MAHINAITHTLEDTQPRDRTSIGPLLDEVADRISRRGIVCLISDCLEDLEPILAALRHLRFPAHALILFHVFHPAGVQFRPAGNIPSTGSGGWAGGVARAGGRGGGSGGA